MAAKDIIKFQMKPGTTLNPHGRPRKWVSELRESGYSISQVNDAIQVLIQMSKEELRIVDTDPDGPMLDRIVARALLASYEKKSLYNIETLLTRVFGKPKELTESKSVSKIVVEYVNRNDTALPPPPGAGEDIERAEEV